MFSVEGLLTVPDFDDLVGLVTDWLGVPRVKLRLVGEELIYDVKPVYLYCHRMAVPSPPGVQYIAEGTFDGDRDGLIELLDRLGRLCVARDATCELTYFPIDATGAISGPTTEFNVPADD